MKISVLAVGRIPPPFAELCQDYLGRCSGLGRGLGLHPVVHQEIEARRRGPGGEADALLAAVPQGAALIACDERGETLSSRETAALLASLRDGGERHLTLVLGGPDGLEGRVRERALRRLAFGRQTWPHALARVMLFEQLYRSLSILAGSPYHRD